MTLDKRRGRYSKYAPLAFTEQGVVMLSSVLRSERAVAVNVAIMRAFVKLREIMATHTDLAHKIEALGRKYGEHDHEIQVIFKAIKTIGTARRFAKAPYRFRNYRRQITWAAITDCDGIHKTTMTTITLKQETLYIAFSPEKGMVSYGGCQDEALNNLAADIRVHERVEDSELATK